MMSVMFLGLIGIGVIAAIVAAVVLFGGDKK